MPEVGPRKLLAGERKPPGAEAREKFERIEAWVVALTSLAVLITAFISYSKSGSSVELMGQVFIAVVFLVSVQYGRIGAVLSAAAATLVYEISRYPDLRDAISFATALELVAIRGLGYLAVGLIGSESMRWAKYYIAKVEGPNGVDLGSGVYSADFIRAMIKREIDLYERYSSVFSLVVVEIDPKELRRDGAFGGKKALRELGSLIKNNVRLVDEVGRLDSGTFAILLPRTGFAGAEAVAERIRDLVSGRFGAGGDVDFSARPYSVPADLVELRAIAGIRAAQIGDEAEK